MAKQTEYHRLAWKDRFNEPNADDLRGGLPPQTRRQFDSLRKYLLQLDGVQERFSWYGDCWRWSIEYRFSGLAESEALVAVLIPSPEDLQLAMLVDPDLTAALPAKQLKRAVRDGLELAADPFDTRWGVWSVQQPNLADELKLLVARKLKHLKSKAGVPSGR